MPDGNLRAPWRMKSIYIPLLIFHFPLRVFLPSSFPSPFCPCHGSNLSCVSERAPNTQYFGSRQKALRTKCLTIQRNNRWPNPKNNRWVSKANEKRGFCQRFQWGSRVFHESEGGREEFSASEKRRLHCRLDRPRYVSCHQARANYND